jgi:PhnB protein
VSLQIDTPTEAERIFGELSQGGSVTYPIDKTFWAERFGMLVDRFGIPWRHLARAPKLPASARGGVRPL